MLLCHLGDVDKTLNAITKVNEGTKGDELRNGALNNSVNGELGNENAPWILSGLLETKGDALTVQVNVQDLDLNFLTNLNDLRRVIDVVPRKLGDVNQTIDATKVNEGTKLNDGRNGTLELHANLKLAKDVLTLCLTCLFKNHTARKNDVIAIAIHLDNASLNTGTHKGAEILHAAKVNKRCGQEAAKTDVKNQAALDNLDDLALNSLAGVELLLNGFPRALVLGTLLGEHQTTLFILFLKNQSLNFIAHVYKLRGLNILADRKLAGRNNALRLISDVKQDLIALNLDDGAGNKVSLVKIGDSAVDEIVHLLIRDVIQRKDGRILNLTQRWTPSKTGPRSSWSVPAVPNHSGRLRKLTCSQGPIDTLYVLVGIRS